MKVGGGGVEWGAEDNATKWPLTCCSERSPMGCIGLFFVFP